MNDISKTMFYNVRIAISEPIDEPIVWRCTKVEQTSPKGTNRLTFAQDHWNPDCDVIDPVNSSGEVMKGIWCNYYTKDGTLSVPEEEEEPVTEVYGKITCAGTQEIKVGGSYKKLSIAYFDTDGPIDLPEGTWEITSTYEQDVAPYVVTKDGDELNELKVKLVRDGGVGVLADMFIGSQLIVRYIPEDLPEAELLLSIVSP